jgi:uncharacterized membrane protein YfcA
MRLSREEIQRRLPELEGWTLEGDALAKAAALGLGTVPGAQVGARIARRLKPRQVLALLGVSLLGFAVRLLVKGIFDV